MTSSHFSKRLLRIFALLGAAGAIVVLFISIRGPSSFPTRPALTAITGTVAWTRPGRYGIDFGLEGDPRTFSYARKSGDLATISTVLTDISRHPITILVNSKAPQQGLNGAPFFQVYEFSSSKGPLRTLAQIKDSRASDYRYGYLASFLALLAAGVLEYAARKVPPNNSFKPNPLR